MKINLSLYGGVKFHITHIFNLSSCVYTGASAVCNVLCAVPW